MVIFTKKRLELRPILFSGVPEVFAHLQEPDMGGYFTKRAGMAYEGTLRANSYIGGEVADDVVYSILRSEWLS